MASDSAESIMAGGLPKVSMSPDVRYAPLTLNFAPSLSRALAIF